MGRESATLIAGLAAAVAFPALALGLSLPLWLSAVVTAGVFAGLWYLLRSGGRAGVDDEALLDARAETARGLIDDASDALARLKQVAPKIQDQTMRGEVQALAKTTDGVIADVRANPDRAMSVRRMFTFYLPNALGVAEGWQTLERHANPSPVRVQQARDTMRALNETFLKFAQDADAPEMQQLDTTLKVLKDSLKSDLEKTA
ncbi:MAG: 5-bromo-4-chloroindolyl phosphate hydrolysis family protein [Alphaproteobacteria bacterium]|nr:5-bromo-4-chloroindolyl phosphate hydrolysis family protein [Alphaproteobacteria bacterium]